MKTNEFLKTIDKLIPDARCELNYKKDYDMLRYVTEEELLTEIADGEKLIEVMLDIELEPLFYEYDFKSKEILDILLYIPFLIISLLVMMNKFY